MTSASDLDKESYCRDVLDPALSRKDTPPPDLLIRYAITEDLRDDAKAFGDRVTEVVKYWRSIVLQQRYRKLAEGLLAAHDGLSDSDQISYRKFAQRRDKDRAQAVQQLELAVADLAVMSTVAGPDMLSGLTEAFGSFLTDAAIRAAVSRHNITITDRSWPLPDRPVMPCRTLATNLTVVGLKLAAEAVFDTATVRRGFRLRAGFRLSSGDLIDTGILEDAKRRLAQRPHSERRTALENVLTTLHTAARTPGGLDALLLWQLIDVLEPQLAGALPPRSLARAALELGLDPGEAPELALAVFSQRQAPRGLRRAVEGAAESGEVLRAQRLAAGLPPGDKAEKKAAEAVAEVEAKLAAANAAEEGGQAERAAELLAEVVATDYDEDGRLSRRLHQLAPPPPAAVQATEREGRVHVEWGPAAARTAGISYRVVRRAGAPALTAAGHVIVETEGLGATDHDPPPADRLYYSVFASRGGDVWSAGLAAPAVVVLPEIADPQLETAAGVVQGSWRVPRGASEVIVTRAEEARPETAVRRDASLAGFVDRDVRAGTRYLYRIKVVYMTTDGQRLSTAGVMLRAVLESALSPVHDLFAELLPGPDMTVSLSWTAPGPGTVAIYRNEVSAPWPPGTVIELTDLFRLGRPVTGDLDTDASGRRRLRADLANGRSCFTAVTTGLDTAMVGAGAAVSAMAPVRDLQARRYGRRIRLRWEWPEGCDKCLVQWRPAGEPAETAVGEERAHLQYDHDGCFEIASSPHPTVVSVRAIEHTRAGLITSVPEEKSVPAADVTVSYRFRPARWWIPWRHSGLVLIADGTCELPPLIVVHSPGRVQPLRAEQGTPVVRTPPVRLATGSAAQVPVAVPGWRPGDWVACFFEESRPDGMALVPAGGPR
jgi:hypothetical protein